MARAIRQRSQLASCALVFAVVSTVLVVDVPRSVATFMTAQRNAPIMSLTPIRLLGRTQMAAGSIDTFDPWTALEISPDAGQAEARKAYKRLIVLYHPDRDPSPAAAAKFDKIVRAFAVVSGEDKKLAPETLLKNAVENLRNDLEFKAQRIKDLKAQAIAEEEEMTKMQERLVTAESKREEVTTELGAFGGAAIGLLVGGPLGLMVGAFAGFVVKDSDNALGAVVRGTGSLAKGVANAAMNMIGKQESNEKQEAQDSKKK